MKSLIFGLATLLIPLATEGAQVDFHFLDRTGAPGTTTPGVPTTTEPVPPTAEETAQGIIDDLQELCAEGNQGCGCKFIEEGTDGLVEKLDEKFTYAWTEVEGEWELTWDFTGEKCKTARAILEDLKETCAEGETKGECRFIEKGLATLKKKLFKFDYEWEVVDGEEKLVWDFVCDNEDRICKAGREIMADLKEECEAGQMSCGCSFVEKGYKRLVINLYKFDFQWEGEAARSELTWEFVGKNGVVREECRRI